MIGRAEMYMLLPVRASRKLAQKMWFSEFDAIEVLTEPAGNVFGQTTPNIAPNQRSNLTPDV